MKKTKDEKPNKDVGQESPENPGLPLRFRRKWSDLLDKRFAGFFIGSIAVHVAVVVYFLLNPIAQDLLNRDIAKMQEHLARTIADREKLLEEQFVQFEMKHKADEPKPKRPKIARKSGAKKDAKSKKPSGKSAKKAPPKFADKPAGGSKNIARKSRRSRRARRGGGVSQAKIASNVGNRGVLALLTSRSNYAAGAEVADVLSRSGHSGGDLDKKLARLTSLKRGVRGGNGRGRGKGRVKGGRSQGTAGIDEMVAGLGDATSQSFSRGGDLVVSAGDVEIEGGDGNGGNSGRNAAEVQGVVLRHSKTIQYCYERELKRNPNLRGKITIRFTITPSGKVKNVEVVASTIKNRSVEKCVVNRIRRWNDFGRINSKYGNTTIRQTYAFGY